MHPTKQVVGQDVSVSCFARSASSSCTLACLVTATLPRTTLATTRSLAATTTAPSSSTRSRSTSTSARTALVLLTELFPGGRLFLHHVNHLIWQAQVLDAVSSYVAFRDFPEALAVARCAHNIMHVEVHEAVA